MASDVGPVAVPKSGLRPADAAILHWRCSDVPFNRHPKYQLPSIRVANDIRRLLKGKGYTHFYVVGSTSFRPKPGAKYCGRLLELYLKDVGIPFTILPAGTIDQDFLLLNKAG